MAINTGVSKDGQVGQTVPQTFANEGTRQVITTRGADDLALWMQQTWELDAEVLAVAADVTDEQAVWECKCIGLSD